MKGFCVHTVWDVSRRNVARYGTPLETHWLRKRHITVHPMNWGLTKFQNDYISAGETFCPKTNILFEPDETNLAMQLLSDLSFRESLELKLIWQLTLILYRQLHAWLSQFMSGLFCITFAPFLLSNFVHRIHKINCCWSFIIILK